MSFSDESYFKPVRYEVYEDIVKPKTASKKTTTKRKPRKTATQVYIDKQVPGLPDDMRFAVEDVYADPNLNDAILALKGRGHNAALLAGAYLNPVARRIINEQMDHYWRKAQVPVDVNTPREVIVGAGLHAAIYCAVRVKMGFPKPIVLEASDRVGGIFAVTHNPAFYLNSRNRPGPLSIPGEVDSGALNVIPGAPIQPSDLSGTEYADNASLAWAIRWTLMMYADVIPNAKVTGVYGSGSLSGRAGVRLDNGKAVYASRVIIATGLGDPVTESTLSGKVLTYPQFMRRMDDQFPLRDMDRIAVIGAGDSGKTVIEALCGQGPSPGLSIAALDYPRQIDWYGVPERCLTPDGWVRNNRSRYKAIGRLLPRVIRDDVGYDEDTGEYFTRSATIVSRVQPYANRGNLMLGYDEIMVNGKPYDLVIQATGFESNARDISPLAAFTIDGVSNAQYANGSSEIIARSYALTPSIYIVGPAANIDVSAVERNASPSLNSVPENTAAIFRYARKTSTLAMTLG
jgi:hypothetical protein